jgi:tetratricopeptide (TPR) repeat protein
MRVVALHGSSDREAGVGQSPVAGAVALLEEIQGLFDNGRHAETIARCEEVAQRFTDDPDYLVRERVAYGLLLKGLSLANLGRSEDAIWVYEELIGRDGSSADQKMRRHVAWAFNNRAFTLKELGRREQSLAAYDELISRFRDEREPEIRQRLSWALWNKVALLEELSRGQEADTVYDELIARRDEGLSVELDRNIAWCLQRRAWNLRQAGATERALKAYEEPLSRFRDATDVWLRSRVAGSLSDKAVVLGELGRIDEAMSTYDESLALLGQGTEVQLRETAVIVLLSKGDALWRTKRFEEAIVVYDGAVEAYLEARAAGGGTEAAWAAIAAVLNKVSRLCALDRSAQAGEARDQLSAILGDVCQTSSGEERSGPHPMSERELAATFAAVFNGGECWRWFEATDEEPPRDTMAERAIELYRLTEPWALADDEAAGDAAQFAASMLRDIADGYAMLTRQLTSEQRRSLPLPRRAEGKRAQLIRTFGADDWATEHGYQLLLPEPAGDVDDAGRCEEQSHDNGGWTQDAFLRFFLTSAHRHDLPALACDFPTGRQALSDDLFGQHAAQQISEARRWARQATLHMPPEAATAAITALLMAQGFFVASHGVPSSSAELFPGTALLRDCLHKGRTYYWLLERDADLPQRLAETDD